MEHVKAKEVTENRKTGPVSATYVTQDSCPDCPFKGNGCYAEAGPTGITTNNLNKAEPLTPEEIAQLEAEAIDSLTGRQDLRLHIVGDCKTDQAALIVSSAMKRHRKKKGKTAWTYTHAWRDVNHDSWQGENILASVESEEQIAEANAKGYACAIVVPKFERDKAYKLGDHKLIPCLYQTKGTQCIDCRLCMNTEALRRTGYSIAFEPHGTRKKKVFMQLDMVNN